MTPRGIYKERLFDFISRAMPPAELGLVWLTLRYPMTDPRQFDQLKRHEFITLLGGALAAWPLVARAQQAKLPTIGLFLGANPSIGSQRVAAFVQRLRELAWIDGRNLAIEYRWAEGRNERAAEIAAEFVRLKVDVIV